MSITLQRGPFDGYSITDDDAEYPFQTLEMPGDPSRMALYEQDEQGRFVFVNVCDNDQPDDANTLDDANPWAVDRLDGAL